MFNPFRKFIAIIRHLFRSLACLNMTYLFKSNWHMPNFITKKSTKRRALKTINVISTLAIILNTGLISAFINPTAASAADTGYKSPLSTNNPNDWTNPNNAFSSNNSYATGKDDSSTNEQGYDTFGFVVPAGSTINGIEVKVEAKSSDTTGCRLEIDLSKDGGANWGVDANTSALTGSDVVYTLGGVSDLWSTTWSPTSVDDFNFSARLRIDDTSGNDCDDAATISVDHVQTKVYYTEAPVRPTPAANPAFGQTCGLDVALVIDSSGSIDNTELGQMKTAFNGFVDAFLPGTPSEFSVTEFDEVATVTQAFTSNAATAKAAVNAAVSGGFTNWDDGFTKAWSTFDPRPAKPNLVLFASDGNPNRKSNPAVTVSEPDAVDAAVLQANTIKNAGTRVIALGIGNDLDVANLQAVSGPNVAANAAQISATSDVITGDFATLGTTLSALAKQLCGGKILVQKTFDTNGDGVADLTGNVPDAQLAGWNFDVNGSPTNPAAQDTTSTGALEFTVANGTYSVTETSVKPGTALVSAICKKGNTTVGSVNGQTVSDLTMGTDETIICTFLNQVSNGNLTVNKEFDDNGDGQVDRTNPDGWTWDIASGTQNIAGGTTKSLTAGTYGVSEDAIPNYSSSWTCSNQTSGNGTGFDVTLAATQDVTCTFRNTRDLGRLLVKKNVLNPDGSEVADTHEFTVTLDGVNPKTIAEGTSAQYPGLATGTYTVAENADGNYTLDGYDVDTDLGTPGAQISITKGQTTVLTVTNKQKKATITISKDVRDFEGGDVIEAGNFSVTSNAGDFTIAEFDPEILSVNPGTYTFEELANSNYTIHSTNPKEITVGSNEEKSYQFVNWQKPSSITVCKYVDVAGDGSVKNDPLYTAEGGWTMWLDDELDQQTVDGCTTFSNLKPGTYDISEGKKDGWAKTTPEANIVEVTVGANDNSQTVSFGNFQLGKIWGYKYDTLQNTLPGWQICLNGDQECTTTNGDGYYEFTGLTAGDYNVTETLQDGWWAVNPALIGYPVNIISGSNEQRDFTNFKLGRISGYKFNDLDGDGYWDEGEPALNGWSICLNGTENCVTTGAGEWPTGYYEFAGLLANTYEVYEQVQAGWTQTLPGDEYEVVITAGTGYGEYQSYNFGNYKYGRISGYKYDWNTEHKLDGWEICLQKQQPILVDQQITRLVTSENPENCVITGAGEWPTGYYEFTGLMAGTYKVYEHGQDGWTQMQPNDPDYFLVNITSGSGYGEYEQYDFWNQRDKGTVTVNKHFDDNGDGQVDRTNPESWSWDITEGEQNNAGGENVTLPTGAYSITEDTLSGYSTTWSCSNENTGEGTSIPVSIAKGQNLTCTFTNTFPKLTIAKVANPAVVNGNQDVTYTITWSVAGAQATNVVVTDPIPANTSYVSMGCGTTTGTCTMSQTGTPVTSTTWNLGTRNPGEGGTLTLVVKTAISVPNGSVIPNTAAIRSAEVDPVFAQADVRAATAPQLQITKTTSATIVNPGDPISYTVKVKNIGTDTAVNAVATDTLPAGFTFVSTSPVATSIVGQTATWNLGNMTVGQEVTLTYTVNVAPGTTAGTYDNIAKAKANNAPEVSTKVPVTTRVPQVLGETTNPVLQLAKTVSKKTVAPGDVVTYTVNIKNTGTGSAINVVLQDILPVGFTFEGTDNTTQSWNLGDIAVGETKTVTYKVKIGASVPNGSYENLAMASADNHGKVTATVPVQVKRGRVLAEVVETGAGIVDFAIAASGLGLIILGFVLTRRKRGTELA